jgi:hypothetical protein
MRIYLAARYSRNPEMREYRDRFHAAGHLVTSRWIDQHGGDLAESIMPEKLNEDSDWCSRFAEADLEDLISADVVISFTGKGGGGKGGRHVKFGFALAHHGTTLIVGPRENVFHCLPKVAQFDGFEECMAWLETWIRPIETGKGKEGSDADRS